jgi:hypothetical protein
MAAGTYSTQVSKGLELTEAWNGKAWHDVSDSVRGNLILISCGSRRFCFGAVQAGRLRAARATEWNGRTWLIYRNNAAIDATCGSPTLCMNLSDNNTEIDMWNGRRWRSDPSTNACTGNPPGDPCDYNDVSCGSASTCMAMSYGCATQECIGGPDQFSTVWNGSSWGSSFSAPTDANLSCSWGDFCMNILWVGAQATIWDDAGWQDVSPDLATICTSAQKCSLNGQLSCGAPQVCVVLPGGSPVSLVWNHLTWKAVPLATIGGKVPSLVSVSCGSATSCMAVGSYGKPSHPVAERWNGSKWQLTKPSSV